MQREEHPIVGVGWGETLLAPLFICFFLPMGPAPCKLGLGRSAVLPEVLTRVLGPSFDLPLFYFSRAFPFLVFQPPPFWTPFPYSNYVTAIRQLKKKKLLVYDNEIRNVKRL